MNTITLLKSLALAATLAEMSCPVAAHPQLPVSPLQRRGPLSGFPAGISLSASTRNVEFGGPTAEAIRFKAPLDQSVQPQPWTDPVDQFTPDYTFATMLAHVAGSLTGFEFDAIDTGNAQLPAFDAGGRPVSMLNTWIMIAASVTNGSVGQSNSLFAARSNPGSDIVSYVFAGSERLPAGLPGKTQLEMYREAFGLTTAADIDGLDFSMGLIKANPGQPEGGWLPNRRQFYFSVSKAWALAVAHPNSPNPLLFANGPNATMVPPDAAVIYVSYWQPTSAGGFTWTIPQVWRTRQDLGLLPLTANPASWEEDIDAIAINPALDVVVYSTQPVLGRNQINVVMPSIAPMTPLRDITNVLITDRLGIGPQDDVDALCVEDPELFAYLVGKEAGTPRDSTGSLFGWQVDPMSMSLCVERTVVNGMTTYVTLHSEFCGWSGEPVPAPGASTVCGFLLTLDDPHSPTGLLFPGQGTLTQLNLFPRFAGQDCVPFSLPIPVSALNGFQVEFKIEAAQLGTSAVTVSWASHSTF